MLDIKLSEQTSDKKHEWKKPAAGTLNLLRKAYGEEDRVIRAHREYLKATNVYVG